MQTRLWIVGGLLLAALLVAVWLWDRESAPPAHLDREVEPSRSTTVAAASDGLVEDPADEPEPTPDDTTARTTVETPDAAPTSTWAFEGSIVVSDPDGARFETESGEARLVLWFGNGGTNQIVAVSDGRFTIEFPRRRRDPDTAPTRLQLTHCRLADRPVLLEVESLDLPSTEPIVFRGRWLPERHLRVLDDESGVDLTDVDVVTGVTWPFSDLEHPSDRGGRAVVVAKDSPVELPAPESPRDGTRRHWVRAPGYAWQRISIADDTKQEHVVRLPRAGSVDLFVLGGKPPEDSAIRFFRGGVGVPIADFAVARDGSQRVDNLLPGTYSVRLQKGQWFRRPLVLAQADVEIRPGARESVELRVDEQVLAPPKTLVAGSLRVPAGWRELERFRITLQPDHETARWNDKWQSAYFHTFERTDDDGVFRWSLGELHCGEYMLTVSPTEHRRMISVREGAADKFEVVVPDPADVLVRPVDAQSGDPIVTEKIVWHGEIPGHVGGYGLRSAKYDADSGGYPFQASLGKAYIGVRAEGYERTERAVEVLTGQNEFTLRIERACGVRVVLDGLEQVAKFALEPIDHDGRESDRGRGWSHVTKPGRYTLRIPPIEGYEPVPDREIDVRTGQMLEVRIPLRKR